MTIAALAYKFLSYLSGNNESIMRILITLMLIAAASFATAQTHDELFKDGVSHINSKEYEKAARCLEQALGMAGNAEKLATLSALAYAQLMSGNAHKALEIKEGDRQLLFQRAGAFMQLGLTEQAIEDYSSVLQADPENMDAIILRAQAYSIKGDYKKAHEEFSRAIAIEPQNMNAKMGLVLLYQEQEKYNEAMVLINLLIEEQPGSAPLYIARSNIEREQGQYELALMDIAKAIEIEPENANYYTLQSILYEKTGNTSAAEKSKNKATVLQQKLTK